MRKADVKSNTLVGRLLSPAGFGLVLILFLLPFVSVSCSVQSATIDSTFTGIDLVTGGTPDMTGPGVNDEFTQEVNALFADELDTDPWALLAAILVMFGMIAGLLRDRLARFGVSAALATVAAALAAVAVFRAPGRADAIRQVFSEQDTPVTVIARPAYGFWLALAALAVLAVGSVVALIREVRNPTPVQEPEEEYEPYDEYDEAGPPGLDIVRDPPN
jgi:hypothetical protein